MFNESTWKNGEKIARDYLVKNGYKVIFSNYKCEGVELDIVSVLPSKIQKRYLKNELEEKLKNIGKLYQKKILKNTYSNLMKQASDLLVVTEVKARKTESYGVGADSVTPEKIKNIKKGAGSLLLNPKLRKMQIRFDVASVDGDKITYIENAF